MLFLSLAFFFFFLRLRLENTLFSQPYCSVAFLSTRLLLSRELEQENQANIN